MKYNIFEILIALSFVCFCIDYTPILILGLIFLIIGGTHVIRHEEEYMEYEDYEVYTNTSSKKNRQKNKKAA